MIMFNLLAPLVPYKNMIIAIVVIAALVGLYVKGYANGERKIQDAWDLEKAKVVAAVAVVEAKQTAATVQTITKYVDRIKIVEVKGTDIIKYVDNVITLHDETACKITDNMISAVNAAALFIVPENASSVPVTSEVSK